jgi:hypothetical protein
MEAEWSTWRVSRRAWKSANCSIILRQRAVIVEPAALYQQRYELVISFRVRWHHLDQLGKIRRRFLLACISRA